MVWKNHSFKTQERYGGGGVKKMKMHVYTRRHSGRGRMAGAVICGRKTHRRRVSWQVDLRTPARKNEDTRCG